VNKLPVSFLSLFGKFGGISASKLFRTWPIKKVDHPATVINKEDR
jgi:hypothetical protein